MKVLIVGATGYIAGVLIEQLLEYTDAEVVAGARRNVSTQFNRRVEFRKLEAKDARSISDAARDVTHVINAVMGSPRTMNMATRNILAVAERAPNIRVVHMSSIAVFGNTSGRIAEDHNQRADDWYSAAKIRCELEAQKAIGKGIDVVIVRPALVYGRNSPLWSTRINRLLVARRLGDLGEMGNGYCNLIHVCDVAAAVCQALTNPSVSRQSFNLAPSSPPTWNEYLKELAHVAGHIPLTSISRHRMSLERKVFAPALRILEIAASKVGLAERVPPPITPNLARLFAHRAIYGSGRADRLFPMGQLDWREGVRDAVASLNY